MLATITALKNIKKVPKNGLAIFCGLVSSHHNGGTNTQKVKLKKICIVIEPIQPIKQGMYKCDNRFHVEELLDQLKRSDRTYGYIIINGDGAIFATVNGSRTEIIHTVKDPNLPNKQRKGGQSSTRFSRNRIAARAEYVKNVAEAATRVFITNELPNVSGLIVAGVAMLKRDLVESEHFDNRLKKIIKQVIDISYGGEAGLKQAIQLSAETLEGLRFSHEKEIVQKFMTEIAKDSKNVVFGVNHTIYALENSAMEKLLVWEDLPIKRFKVCNQKTKEESYVYLTHENQIEAHFQKNNHLEILDEQLLLDYLIEECKKHNTPIEIISNHTSEGKQFCQGFGGIGGFLRFSIDLDGIEEIEDSDDLAEFI